ncbi:MAG: thioredoxin family protein [Planctomycetales bacterium]|nr:thioredoxin family protein [Planctomycetales bacterium]
MRSVKLLGVALTTLIAATACNAAEIEIGAKAPDFTAKGVDGKEYGLQSALKGSDAVVVCFTCNKCPVAVAYEDRFIDFAKQYADKKVQFLAINCNTSEDLAAMKQRAEEKGFPYPYAYEDSGDAARGYGARVTPHLFVVNKDGKVVYHGAFDNSTNNPTVHYVASAVDAALAGKLPEVTTTKAVGCGIRPKRQ